MLVKLCKLGDVCEKTFNINWKNNLERTFKYIDLSTVSREKLSILESDTINVNNAPSRAKQIVHLNDIIFGTTRPTLKRIAIVPKEYDNHICSTGFAVLRINNNLACFKYIFYSLQSVNFMQRMEDVQRGASYPAVSNKDVMSFKIPLPPLTKQKAIAKKLDKAKELIELRKESIKKLDELSKAIFIDMFGDSYQNPMDWEVRKLRDLTILITDGVHQKPEYYESGIPFISVKDITTGRLKFEKCKYIDETQHMKFSKRCQVEKNDILYTKIGATYGRACISNTNIKYSLYVSVCLIKPNHDKINFIFLKELMNSQGVKIQADKSIKGIGVPDLHLIEIKKFNIISPPLNLQEKFAKTIQKIEAQKALYEEALEKLEYGFEALLSESFG